MKTHKIIETHETKEMKEKTETSEDSSRDEMTQYPSAFLLLESAKDEYTKERERSSILDGKAAHFMTAILLVVTVFIPIIPLTEILPFYASETDCVQLCIVTLIIIVLLVSFGVLIAAFKSLYDAYKLKSFERFNSNNLDDELLHREAQDYIARTMCADYKEHIDYNIEENGRKAESVTKGLRLCGVGFLLLAGSAMILRVVIGG